MGASWPARLSSSQRMGVLMVCALGWQVKPHLFTHTKHRIAQLNTLLSQRQQ